MNDQLFGYRQFADARSGRIGERDGADIFGVVGDAHPVEWSLDLDVIAERVLDSLPLRVFVCVGRRRLMIAKDVGVKGPAGMNVGLAKIGLSLLGVGRCEDE